MASIKRRPDGKWRARYRDADGREHSRHFSRKIDGQAWLDEVTASVVTGMYVDPDAGKLTFSDYWQQWSSRQIWVRGTKESADQAAASATFSQRRMNTIKRGHIESWIKGMTAGERPLAPSTIRTRYNYVSMSFRAAVRDRVISVDPTAGVRLPRARRAEHTMVIPTPGQVRAALDNAAPEHRALVAVCAFAGLRLGEAAGLRADDLDAAAGLLSVRRQVQGTNVANAEVVPPKAGSERVIAVPAELVDILREHINAIGTIRAEGYLFTSGGHLLNRSSAGHIWRMIRKRAGLPAEYTLHTLRHFYASALIAAGCDVVTVQRALGHAQPSITLNTYSHLWNTAEDRTRAATADLMKTVLDTARGPMADREQPTAP